MNNDLISREALLKAMEEERQYLLARGQTGAEHIIVHHCLPIIDNAPTVSPERPQGDLISREALKKCAIPCEIHNGALTDLCIPLYQIDNAPTVEPEITNDDLQAAMTESYRLGYELAETKFKRPQGEWIPVSERLPEYTGLYLISVDDVVTVANFTGTYFMHRGGGRVKVYAWMPLPEPYKKDGTEE